MKEAPSQQVGHIVSARDMLKSLEPAMHEVVITQVLGVGGLNPSVSGSCATITNKVSKLRGQGIRVTQTPHAGADAAVAIPLIGMTSGRGQLQHRQEHEQGHEEMQELHNAEGHPKAESTSEECKSSPEGVGDSSEGVAASAAQSNSTCCKLGK